MNLNVKIFNIMSRINEKRHITGMRHVSVNLDASLCNNKQPWNDDKCRCECQELIDQSICDKWSI